MRTYLNLELSDQKSAALTRRYQLLLLDMKTLHSSETQQVMKQDCRPHTLHQSTAGPSRQHGGVFERARDLSSPPVVFNSSELTQAVYIRRNKSRFWPRSDFSSSTSNKNDNFFFPPPQKLLNPNISLKTNDDESFNSRPIASSFIWA